MSNPEELISSFERVGWKCEPFVRMLEMVHHDPADAFRLLTLAIERGTKSATFLDAAVSFVPESMLPELAAKAVEAFDHDRKNEVAEATIAYVSMQSPRSLQPYLLRLFLDLRPNARSYYANWAWRGAAERDVDGLLEYMARAPSEDERTRAFLCILETRDSTRIQAARMFAPRLPYPEQAYLEEVGIGDDGRLYASSAFHMRFPLDYLRQVSRPAWQKPENHPSWCLEPVEGANRFGGPASGTCPICDGELHNLLSIEKVPTEIAAIITRPRIEIVTCLSCLGWSESTMYFRHDDQGRPRPVPGTKATPEFPVGPLAETTIQLAPTPDRWLWQSWGSSNSRENLHRLGGHPTWVQSAQYPECVGCGQAMAFLLQLDSNLPTAEGDDWLWGSGGIAYVFWCDACSTSAMLWQCT